MLLSVLVLSCVNAGCSGGEVVPPLVASSEPQRLILESAKKQAEEGAFYSAGYAKLDYPMGDVPADRGACTDVVIRALRAAGYDLQQLIHEDMKQNFKKYPRRGSKPDPNIDHRRCPNQIFFLKRFGKELTKETEGEHKRSWQPGDIVYWKLDNGLDHTGILSDRRNSSGLPYVIHNLGRCAEEDVLTEWKIVGHYRFPKS